MVYSVATGEKQMSVNAFKIGNAVFNFAEKTAIMGILNVTPDSFSDGGRYDTAWKAVEHAFRLKADGADIIDIGGESTRPGSERLSTEAEMERVIPVIESLKGKPGLPISIDTYKAEVARRALDAGADLVNDISGLSFDPEMAALVAERGCPLVIMHTLGDPKIMQNEIRYADPVDDIRRYFEERLEFAERKGIAKDRIILDPGIGFGKKLPHNVALIRHIGKFAELGCPILLGASRKSFIGQILDLPADERLEGSLAAAAAGIAQGVSMLRVHDVKETSRLRDVCDILFGKREAEERN